MIFLIFLNTHRLTIEEIFDETDDSNEHEMVYKENRSTRPFGDKKKGNKSK